MTWYKKLLPTKVRTEAIQKRGVPEGVWSKCPECNSVLYRAELERNLEVCPKCAHHLRISARKRLGIFLDPDEYREIAKDITANDRLKFKDSKKYRDRLIAAEKKSGETEAIIVMEGKLIGRDIVAAAFDFAFMGGSMGYAVGQRFTEGVFKAIEKKCPMVSFTSSGGARMQEGLISLMQMAKVSAILADLAKEKLPFISVMTDPTTGGVSASLAMLGDINIAEPNALIGFAGPRVIEQTVRQTLPEGFQRSEFLLEHGAIDMIVDRREMRDVVARHIAKMMKQSIPA